MLQNYIKISLRNLIKYKSYTLINIFGLAFGIALFLLIVFFVKNELSYDKFNSQSDRIYRVALDRNFNGTQNKYASGPMVLGPTISKDIPQVEECVRLLRDFTALIKWKENEFPEGKFFFVDKNIFKVFDLEIVKGNKINPLDNPTSIVINETTAKKYFGDSNPIGKTLTYKNYGQIFDFNVSAVIKDLPHNSHFSFDMLAEFNSQYNLWNMMHKQDWYYAGNWTYVLLKENADKKQFENELTKLVKNYFPEPLKKGSSLFLQPLPSIHLDSHLKNEIDANGDSSFVVILSIIGSLVLLIACINFINLATSRSLKRAKETGIRKLMGATRKNLVYQFLIESSCITLFSILFGLVIAEFISPVFEEIIGKNLNFAFTFSFENISILFGIWLTTSLLAGTYPAFYLSSNKPVDNLRFSKGQSQKGNAAFRKILVVTQFAITIILISGIGLISQQLNYIRNINLGFNKEQIISIPSVMPLFANYEAFVNELRNNSNALEVSGSSGLPGSSQNPFETYLVKHEGMMEGERKQISFDSISEEFINMFGLKVTEGRGFSKDFQSDFQDAFVINETAAKVFGWDDPLNKEIEVFNVLGNRYKSGKVIGVLKDFNFESVHNNINPLVFAVSNRVHSLTNVKLAKGNYADILGSVETTWKKFASEFPFEFNFLDDDIQKLYEEDQKFELAIKIFSGFAIFISCLGLLGLISYMAEQKTKEIGIRKTLGASIFNLVFMLEKEMLTLIIISNVFAWPVAYYLLNEWLQNFAYQVEINLTVFFVAGLAAFLIAFATISFQAVKHAARNPVETLRTE